MGGLVSPLIFQPLFHGLDLGVDLVHVPSPLLPVRDLRDLGPSARRAIWRAKLREFKAQRTAQKKRGWDMDRIDTKIKAIKKRMEDEGVD